MTEEFLSWNDPPSLRRAELHAEQYGYDLARVGECCCLVCGEPIGNESYVPNETLSRFGQMMFVHARCRRPGEVNLL